MEQLIQRLKDGEMQLMEVPFPTLLPGHVLVKNHYSVISPGTEGKTVKDARLSYIGKAKARKEEVKKVIATAKTVGLMKTYNMVMNKLEAYSPLGYSCAGEIIAMADDVKGFQIGDHVACGGNTASHSEVIAAPVNLCVKLKKDTPLEEAAFTTIGAIAMQGIRQAELSLGESCLVIGLGIIGQISMQLLEAAGVNAIGIDIDQRQVDFSKGQGKSQVFNRNHPDLEEIIQEWSNGYGTDAVIITASTGSTDPVELAGRTCRKKGKVIIVGAVPTGFSRKNYFKKELDLRMSSSYGPGRYESNYEEKGLDYPIGFVRWTENRNMQAFADLVHKKALNLSALTSHEFDFKKAAEAYQLILDKEEVVGGILLKYDTTKELKSKVELKHESRQEPSDVKVGMIGAGSFAQNFLLPALKGKVELIGINTARPTSAKYIADKYGFTSCESDGEQLAQSSKINTVFIATRHNTHAEYVLQGLRNNKNVFVEKPLCMNEEDLTAIKKAYSENQSKLMVGFNRRFAPMTAEAKHFLGEELPKSITYRINAGQLPLDHWVHDPEVGGGRIIGEACHFIDLAQHFAGSLITSVSANALESSTQLMDNVSIQLGFENGSIASINYFSNGSKKLPKEYIEVHSGGKSVVIEDFKKITLAHDKLKVSKADQDKGYAEEIEQFTKSIKTGSEQPIPFEEICLSTLASFKAIESIQKNGEKIELDLN